MKVSSWAVSRILWGPLASCSCWMPTLQVKESAGQKGWHEHHSPARSGPLDLPQIQSSPLSSPCFLSYFPSSPSWAEMAPPSRALHKVPQPWLGAGPLA